MKKRTPLIYVIVPDFDGGEDLILALKSLMDQSMPCKIVVVDNGSTVNSAERVGELAEAVIIAGNEKNLGFAGGVNTGIRLALNHHADFIALLNNDAVADRGWLENLLTAMDDKTVGVATPKITSYDGKTIDSTGEFYTAWGMPFPRGRGEPAGQRYAVKSEIFAGSGAASLYRAEVFKQVGLFDEDFFAYFEDVDIGFRAQLAGWKSVYIPDAIVKHKISATSSKLSGFGTFHSFKNLPMLFIKNVPLGLMPGIGARFFIFYWSVFFSSLLKDSPLMTIKGATWALVFTPKKIYQRYKIQKTRRVDTQYIRSIIVYDLPPDSKKLRKLRKIFGGA